MASEFYTAFLKRCELFFTYKSQFARAAGKATGTVKDAIFKVLYGRPGLKAAWEDIEAWVNTGAKNMKLDDLELFKGFVFMLTSEQKAALREWTKTCLLYTSDAADDM
eukprot:864560-Lingulodinium_polyedra.AAC.1